jgi:hypothetical protein
MHTDTFGTNRLTSNIAQTATPLWIRIVCGAQKERRPAVDDVDNFLHEANLLLLHRHLAESDPTKNPQRHSMLLRLLAEERAKDDKK